MAPRSFVLRVSAARTLPSRAAQQISLGKTQRTSIPHRHHYACGSAGKYRISPSGAGSSTAHALRRFTFVRRVTRTYGFYRTPPSRADQRFTSLWPSRGAPQQRTCLIGVEFPLPGPQVWTFTSCSLLMPDTLLRRPGAGSPLLHCGQYPSLPRRRCTRAPAGSRAPVGARTTFAAAEAGHAGAAGKGGAWSRRRKAGDTEAPACPASAAACQAGAAPASPASAAADQAGEARGQDALAPCPR